MQENLRAQEKSKNDGVNSLARKFDADKVIRDTKILINCYLIPYL